MNRDDEIFGEAIALPEGQRTAFVAQACGGDDALRARIAALLVGHGKKWDYLETLAQRRVELPEEKPGDVIGSYTLRQKIGEGGCGRVYLAEQEEPVRRRVALKVIKLGMDTREVIARFEAERQALALMDHPNIARVLEAGATDTGRPFFAMELVHGVPLTTYCDEQRLGMRDRLALFVQVCRAVQHAHQKGIIHRDLKPSNILVTRHDGRPVPKIIDFGIAKATQGRLTERTVFTAFEHVIGTPAYMSPEQAELTGLDVDTRADVYALGVLLYELLTGRTPFDGKELLAAGVDEMRRRIREVEPPRPSARVTTLGAEQLTMTAQRRCTEPPRLVSLLRGDLDWIVMRCLEKDRTRRYETATSLAQDLERHLANEPVSARPPSTLYRLRKMARRNRLAVAAGAAVLAALVGGLGVSAWAFGREREARLHARRLLYAADMNLAQQSLNLNNLARARVLLERHRSANTAERDLRGWEWRYLWQQTRSDAIATFDHRRSMVSALTFAPDSRRFVIGYADGRVERWDAETQQRIEVLVDGANAPARAVFAPEGNVLLTTIGSGVIERHDFDAGTRAIFSRLQGDVRDLAFSADGTRLAVLSLNDEMHLVDAATGNVAWSRAVPSSGSPWFDGVRLSPDLQRVYYSGFVQGRPIVRCARAADGATVWELATARREGVTALELSPNGRFLVTATGYERDAIQVWNADTGALVTRLDAHTKFVARLSFSRDGAVMASGSSDQTVRLWDTRTWQPTAMLRGHEEEIYGLAVSPDGAFAVSGAEDGVVLLWKAGAPTPARSRRTLPAHVRAAWPLPGGQAVLALADGKERRFSVINLATLEETPVATGEAERTFFVPPNVFAEHDGKARVQVYEVHAYGRKPLGEVAVGPRFEDGFAFHGGRRLFAWTDGARTLHVASLDAPTNRLELACNLDGIRPLNFSPDGKIVRARWGDAGVAWDLETRTQIEPTDAGGVASDARSAHLGSPNRAALPLTEMRRHRFDPRLQQIAPRIGALTAVASSPDGRWLAASSETGFLAMGEVANLANFSVLAGNMQDVDALVFSPDGQRLATTSHGDEIVKLWDVETRQELLALSGVGSEIYAVHFTEDGNTLLAGRSATFGRPTPGLCQFWTAPSWEEIARAERIEAERTAARQRK